MNAKFLAVIFSRREAAVAAEDARQKIEQAESDRAKFYETKEGKKRRAAEDAHAQNTAIRAVHAGFRSALPSEARNTGSFSVPEGHRDAGPHPVKNGAYRVMGSDWVMRFMGGLWVGADRAHSRTDPDWIDIPDTEAALPPING